MSIFKKKDYNLILEKILDSKYFSSNSKSLLLSMTYKLEDFYNDYKMVKNIDTTKDEFLDLVLDTIKKYCNNIKVVEPNVDSILNKNKVLAVTNEKEKSLLCYPSESSMLYAISDIMPKFFYIDDNFEYKNSFQRTLVNGYNLNTLEILSDFNGWSWDSNVKNKNNFQDILIYQNLVIVFGNSFMEEWKSKAEKNLDYLNEIRKYFSKTKYFDFLCKYLVLNLTSKEKDKKNKELEIKSKELEEISDKINYIEKLKKLKLKYLKELDNITLILNNKDLMRKEYMFKNSKLTPEKRIATLGTYKKMIEVRREKVVNEISRITAMMNPVNYINHKMELEKFIEINFNQNADPTEILINLQEEFIKSINEVCFETEDITSLKNLIIKLRYYRFLFLTEDKQIKDIPNLNDEINKIIYKAIQKLVVLENVKKISNNDELNKKIITNILDTKIIDLNSIMFEYSIKENSLEIKTFEKEVFEKSFEIEGKFLKKNFEIKPGKKYKLFI